MPLIQISNGISPEHYQEVSFKRINGNRDFIIHESSIGRQWAYLQCTQAGLFQITDSGTWLPNRIEFVFHVQECQDILGPE